MNEKWTPETVEKIISDATSHEHEWRLIADAHNAALASSNSQLDDAGSHNAAADRELRELRQQLADERQEVKIQSDAFKMAREQNHFLSQQLAAEREQHQKDIGALIEGHAAKVLSKVKQ